MSLSLCRLYLLAIFFSLSISLFISLSHYLLFPLTLYIYIYISLSHFTISFSSYILFCLLLSFSIIFFLFSSPLAIHIIRCFFIFKFFSLSLTLFFYLSPLSLHIFFHIPSFNFFCVKPMEGKWSFALPLISLYLHLFLCIFFSVSLSFSLSLSFFLYYFSFKNVCKTNGRQMFSMAKFLLKRKSPVRNITLIFEVRAPFYQFCL